MTSIHIGGILLLGFCAAALAQLPVVTHITPRVGSIAGGHRITIYGSNFPTNYFTGANEPDPIVVTLTNSNGEAVPCDLHKDGCTANQIMCYTNRMHHLVKYSVQLNKNGTQVPPENLCGGPANDINELCKYKGNKWLTPTIDSLESQSGKVGNMMIKMHGAIFTVCRNTSMTCPNTVHGFQAIITRAYAQGKCELQDESGQLYNLTFDTTDADEHMGNMWCKPTSTFVGPFNVSYMLDSYGRSKAETNLLRVSRTGTIYTMQAFTTIDSVTPTEGSTQGGTELTVAVPYIEDAGPLSTYSATEVFVGGESCTNIQVTTDTNVKCLTPAQPNKPYYRGNRGVTVEVFTPTSFNTADEAKASTAAAASTVIYDETKVCGDDINANWLRMTGAFVAPATGQYCPSIKTTTGGKLFVDQTEFGQSTGNWACNNRLELTAGQEVELIAVAEPGDCFEVKMVYYNTTFLSLNTGLAVQERQILRATSTVVHETWTMSFSGSSAVTETPEVQRICLTEQGDVKRQVGLYGVYTAKAINLLNADELATALGKFPFLNVTNESFSATVTGDCVDVTFNSKRGDIPNFTVLPDVGATVTEVTKGVSDSVFFAMEVNNVPGPLLQYNADGTVFAAAIQESLEGMFGVQCPSVFNSGQSFEAGPATFSSATSEVPAFCGRYSLMNSNQIYPYPGSTAVRIALTQWMCFAVSGLDNNQVDLRYTHSDGSYRYKSVNFDTIVDGNWSYTCIDINTAYTWEETKTLVKLNRVRMEQKLSELTDEDFYVDALSFGSVNLLTSIDNITNSGSRLGPAYPNANYEFTMDSIAVTYDAANSQFDVTLKPNDCGYDFSLPVISGSPSSPTMTVTRVTAATQGLTGTFKLTYNGVESPAVDISLEEADMKQILETIPGIGSLNLFKSQQSTCANFDLYIEFSSLPGDVQALIYSSAQTDLTAPSTAAAELVQNIDGHFGYNPIPGDMIFTKHSDPQVTVYVNGMPTRCGDLAGDNCAFTYSLAQTPTITGLNTNTGFLGETRILSGDGFSTTQADNNISIGGSDCTVTAATESSLTFTVPNGPLGEYPVILNVAGKGIASGDVKFTYAADLTSCDVTTSTTASKVAMTCTGYGFATASEVMVGTQLCDKVSETVPTSITCTVPSHTDLTTGATVQVSVVNNGVTCSTTVSFTYTVSTAVINSVTTAESLTTSGGQTISVTGANLGTDGSVYLGGVELTVVSRDDTAIEVQTPSPMKKGMDQELWVMQGTSGAILNSANAIPVLSVPLLVNNMNPTSGSKYGGTQVTLTGNGFGSDEDAVEIMFGDTECEVESLSYTQIVCEINHPGQQYEITIGDGQYFAFSQTSIMILTEDTIRFSWTTPDFLLDVSYSVCQANSLTATACMEGGFNSGARSRQGSYSWQFNEAGIFNVFSRADDYRSFTMQVTVEDRVGWKESLSLSVGGQEADYNINSGVAAPADNSGCAIETADLAGCTPETVDDPDATKFNFLFTSCRTPVLESVDFTDAVTGTARSGNADTVLTFTGTGFSTQNCANRAKIGDEACTVSGSTATEVTCSPASGSTFELGTYLPLTINVNQYGNARESIATLPARSIAFVPSVSSISPTSGSTKGGTPVTISAVGFTDISQVSVTFHNVDADCELNGVNALVCISPYSSTGAVKVNVNGFDSTCTACTFTYASAETPSLTTVTPASVGGQTTLVFEGTNLGTDASKLTLTINGEECTSLTNTDTTLQCTVQNVAAGPNDVTLLHADKGYADTSAVSVAGVGIVNTPSPASGSEYGGTNVSITGYGFSEDVTILVGSDEFCSSIYYASRTQIYCETASRAAGVATLKISSNGYDFSTVDFTVSSTSPSILVVAPASGNEGDQVTLTVADFGSASSADIKVWIGDAECTSVNYNSVDTEVTCTAGSEVGGSHAVKAHVAGVGNSNTNVQFTYQVEITSLTTASGDELGGQLLGLNGGGFTEDMTVTVCGNPCVFERLESAQQYYCVTPSGSGACDVVASQGSSSDTLAASYTYVANSAPRVTGMSPTRGGTGGNTAVTFTGTGFSSPSVTIDGVECVVSSSTATSIECNTGAHTGSKLSEVIVDCNGNRGTWVDIDHKFNYVDVWSSTATWGGEHVPIDGEMIVIPHGQSILLDTDTAILSMLLIEGDLIFDAKDVSLKAERILINNGGSLQVGTADEPFEYNALIEMHGTQRSKEMPIYGTKVLAVRNGTLDLHGKRVTNPWTLLASTAAAGATQIEVQGDLTGWYVGAEIAIASTGSFESFNENEQRTIMAISGQTITLNEALNYKHTGVTDTYNNGAYSVEYRAEVQLLSRNVLFRGSEDVNWQVEIEACEAGFDTGEFATQTCFQGRFGDELSSDEFGGTLMAHGAEMDTQVAVLRLSNVEFTHVGQANRLGRYPIHFHINGIMDHSYVNSCSIHHTFNRGINIHATHYLNILNNNMFNTRGGTTFLEDGVEHDNVIDSNCVVFVRSSTSLLNDDITPAAFWITNPNNIVRNNRAAGGTHFGYWFRMHDHPDGPSFDPNIFPKNVPLGIFENNVAHSFGWFGVWVFHSYFPCDGGNCASGAPVVATFENFVAWGNKKGGEFVDAGALQVDNSKFVYNHEAGFEWKRVWDMEKYSENGAMIKNTLIAGYPNDATLQDYPITEHGIVVPYGDGWQLKNVVFENFNDAAVDCLSLPFIDGTCSDRCGGYNVETSGLTFTNVVNRVKWRWEWEVVFHDLDGTLCGTGAPRKIIPKWGSVVPSDCATQCTGFGGMDTIDCPDTRNFHRMSFNNPGPSSLGGKNVVLTNDFGTSEVKYMFKKLTHMNGWTLFFASEEMNIAWENAEAMFNISYSAQLNELQSDQFVIIKHALAGKPDRVSLNGGSVWGEEMTAALDSSSPAGAWYYDEATDIVSVMVRGNPAPARRKRNTLSATYSDDIKVSMRIEKCLFPNCEPPVPLGQDPTLTERPSPFLLWDDVTTWEVIDGVNVATGEGTADSVLPGLDEDVLIPRDSWVVVKSYNPPSLGTVTIIGGLEIDNTTASYDYLFKANFIVVIGGQFSIGWPDYPMTGSARVQLRGSAEGPTYSNVNLTGYEVGKKALVSFGNVGFYGADVGTTWSTLASTANSGSTSLNVANPSDISNWSAGDEVIVTSTSYRPLETEKRTIQSVDASTGVVVLTQALSFRHGAGSDAFGASFAGAVGLLTRSIKVEGEVIASETFGGRALTAMADYSGDILIGSSVFSNVEFLHMGQDGFTEESDPRFAVAFAGLGAPNAEKPSRVAKCSFHDLDSTAIGVFGTPSFTVTDNVIYKPVGIGIITTSDATTITNNLVANLLWTGSYKGRSETYNFRYEAAIDAFFATNVELKHNYASGSERVGFHVAGEDCTVALADSNYLDNTAVGNLHGVSVAPNEDMTVAGITSCTRFSNFKLYKNFDAGIYYNNQFSVQITNNIFADNTIGIFPMVHGPPALSNICGDKTVTVKDNIFIGTSSASDCSSESAPSGTYLSLSGSNRPKRGGRSFDSGIAVEFGQFTSAPNNFPEKPCFNIMAYNALCGETVIQGSRIANFDGVTRGCKANYFIGTNPANDDLQHYILIDTTDQGAAVDSRYLLSSNLPNVGTINPADCVDMACDAMKKTMIRDKDGSTFGTTGTVIPDTDPYWDGTTSFAKQFGIGDFRIPKDMLIDPYTEEKIEPDVIAPNGRGVLRNGCNAVQGPSSAEEYYFCPNINYNLLIIESLAPDTETRRLSPVAVNADGFLDLINGPQDHGWCSGYTCQKRVSLFHSLVVPGIDTEVFFSSTPPEKMRLKMIATEADTDCLKVAVYIPDPFRWDFYINDGTQMVNPMNLDNTTGVDKLLREPGVDYRPTCEDVHGSNYVDFDTKMAYMVLKGSLDVRIKKANVVVVSFTFMTTEQVFGDNIVANLAGLLDIDLSMIRIVNIVAEGSRRRKREASTDTTIMIGDEPTANTDSAMDMTTQQVEELAAILMDYCQSGSINEQLDALTDCLQIVLDSIVYVPTPPDYLAFTQTLESQHENVPFSIQPKIRAYDQYNNVISDLGIAEHPWQITASILSCTSCHGDAALIGTTTVEAVDGWFNFTDLGISHKGDGYVLEFKITAPSTAVSMNLSVESTPISVDGLPMTAGVHSMTVGDIGQGDSFSMTFDLRDETTDIQLPDLRWRDHTAFTMECDLVVESATGDLTTSTSLMQSFDMDTGVATFDFSYSGYGLFYIGCHTESSPAEYSFDSVHKVFVIGDHQVNIPSDVTKNVKIKYDLDFNTALPTPTAIAQFHQAVLEHFISEYPGVVIRESDIMEGSILITFTLDGSNPNVTSALEDICEEISDGLTVSIGLQQVKAAGYMVVDGQDYYATCGKEEEDDDDGLHPAYIALIVILVLIVLAAVIFLVVWRCKIRPNQKTHDNGRTVFLAGPNQKVQDIFHKQKVTTGINAENVAPVATLYDDTPGYLDMRKSPMPIDPEIGARTYSNLAPTGN